MASKLKTQPTRRSVKEFLRRVENERMRRECMALLPIMEQITGEKDAQESDPEKKQRSDHQSYANRQGRNGLQPRQFSYQ